MPKIENSAPSTANFYANEHQTQAPPAAAASSTAAAGPAAAAGATATASTTPSAAPNELSYDGAYDAVGPGLAYDGLLQKYASDLSAFRRSNPPPEPPATGGTHNPALCDDKAEAATLNCLDAAANVMHAIAAVRSPGIDALATGMQVGTSSIRCVESVLEAREACSDKPAPETVTP